MALHYISSTMLGMAGQTKLTGSLNYSSTGQSFVTERPIFHLTFTRTTNQKALMNPKMNMLVWNSAEKRLQGQDADILLIFDCCDAGCLRSRSSRTFEFLGACASGKTTQGPGKYSFTSALLWALRDLSKDGRGFDTRRLKNKISEYEHFPKEQVVQLFPRNEGPDWAHIYIQPKHPTETSRSRYSRESTPERNVPGPRVSWQNLDFRLTFDKYQTEEDMKKLAHGFNYILSQHETLRRVQVTRLSGDLVVETARFWRKYGKKRAERERRIPTAETNSYYDTMDTYSVTDVSISENGPPQLEITPDSATGPHKITSELQWPLTPSCSTPSASSNDAPNETEFETENNFHSGDSLHPVRKRRMRNSPPHESKSLPDRASKRRRLTKS